MAAITFYLLLLRIFTFIWFAFAGTSIFHSCVCVREKKKWAREKRDLFRCFGQMPSVRRQANHLHTTSSCSVTATETHSYWSMDVTAIPMYRTISIVESSNFVANRARAWKRCFRENSMKSLIVVDRVHKHPFFSSHLQFTLCVYAQNAVVIAFRLSALTLIVIHTKLSSAAHFVRFGLFWTSTKLFEQFLCERVLKTLP